MKILITGANGTVGTGLRKHLKSKGHEVIAWDRTKVDISNYHDMERYIKEVNPNVIYHLAILSEPTGMQNEDWVVNYLWPSELAWISKNLNIKFVFTSTALVFSNDAKGPFTPQSHPDADEGYGRGKLIAEERIFYQNPNSYVLRIGWQIGEDDGTNNMVAFLSKQMRENGKIECSDSWYPACSFIEDTARALEELIEKKPSLYMFDSNKKWTFYEIVLALKEKYNKDWKVIKNNDYKYDQRLIDDRLCKRSLAKHISLNN